MLFSPLRHSLQTFIDLNLTDFGLNDQPLNPKESPVYLYVCRKEIDELDMKVGEVQKSTLVLQEKYKLKVKSNLTKMRKKIRKSIENSYKRMTNLEK